MHQALVILMGCLVALVGVIPEGKTSQLELAGWIDRIGLGNGERSNKERGHCAMAGGFSERESVVDAQEHEDADGPSLPRFSNGFFDVFSSDDKFVIGVSVIFPWKNHTAADFSDLRSLSRGVPSKIIAFCLYADSRFQQNRFSAHENAASGGIPGIFEGVSQAYVQGTLLKSELVELGADRYPGAMFRAEISASQIDGLFGSAEKSFSGSPQSEGEPRDCESRKSCDCVSVIRNESAKRRRDVTNGITFIVGAAVLAILMVAVW